MAAKKPAKPYGPAPQLGVRPVRERVMSAREQSGQDAATRQQAEIDRLLNDPYLTVKGEGLPFSDRRKGPRRG